MSVADHSASDAVGEGGEGEVSGVDASDGGVLRGEGVDVRGHLPAMLRIALQAGDDSFSLLVQVPRRKDVSDRELVRRVRLGYGKV